MNTVYVDSLREALGQCMAENPDVLMLGEDLLDPYGGAFKVSKGLSTRFPDQILPTPIAEAAIIGLATGLALRGCRPVAEIMFGDFLTLCADQIINSATKFPLMYKGKITVPWVIRTPVAGARGYGPTHSQSLEKLFFGVPGLDVLAPSRAHDPGAGLAHLIRHATRPALFIEDKGDYAQRLVTSGDRGLAIRALTPGDPLPVLEVRNAPAGRRPDVAVLAYGGAASIATDVLAALVEEEIDALLLAPARINDPAALRAMLAALPPGVPVIIAEQGTAGFGWASEVMALMLEAGQSPPRLRRISARADIIPAARPLEAQSILTQDALRDAMFEVLI